MSGWIKLHRSLSFSGISRNPEYLAVWVHLLLKAQHSDHSMLVGRQVVHLKAGQLVFGRIKFSQETGVSENKIRSALKAMEDMGMITIKSHTKYSIISITKWHDYQSSSPTNNHEIASSQPADSQQIATNNNVKNEKNEKNDLLKDITPTAKPSAKSSMVTFTQWIDGLNESGEDAIPADHPIFEKAQSIGITRDYLALAWYAFRRNYTNEASKSFKKKYAGSNGWRRVFVTAVMGDYLDEDCFVDYKWDVLS